MSSLQHASVSDLTDSFLPEPKKTPKAVGYTVMRSGVGPTAEVCLVVPYVGFLKSAIYNRASRGLDVGVSGVFLTLPDLPGDVIELLLRAPAKALVVSVDALSRARSSIRISAFAP